MNGNGRIVRRARGLYYLTAIVGSLTSGAFALIAVLHEGYPLAGIFAVAALFCAYAYWHGLPPVDETVAQNKPE